MKIKAVNFGFTITLARAMDKAVASLEVEAMGGSRQRIPYATLQAAHPSFLKVEYGWGWIRKTCHEISK